MDEFQRYRDRVDAYWPGVDRYFDDLPGDLHRQGRLLRENLALGRSRTGRFHDILRRPDDHPLLHYHLWLCDDVDVPDDEQRRSMEEDLFAAMVLSLGVAVLQRNMQTADSFIDERYVGLTDALSRQATRHFAAVVATDAPFWDTHRQLWDAAAAALAGDGTKASTEPRQAPFLLSGLAVFEATGRTEHAEPLLTMLGHLNAVLSVRHDLLAIRRDLARGTVTAPVRQMMEAVGIADDAVLHPERLLGTLLLAGAVDAVADTWRTHLAAMAHGAADLGLPTFERYGEHLDNLMEASLAVLRVPAGRHAAGVPSPTFAQASAPLPEAIEMAERFLLADPTFRDAWEVHRWGMTGAPEVTARFPSGLVIEVLGRHGHDVADLVDEFYRLVGEQGYAYYDHPELPYVETDTIGTMLRLYPYSKQAEWHRNILDELTALLESHVTDGGRLPVWLVDAGDAIPPLLGEGCATIEANLLRGLLVYDAERFAPIVIGAAEGLFRDFIDRGPAITVNYPRPYLLVVLAALLTRLGDRMGPLEPAWKHLGRAIAEEAAADRPMPMTSACLTLACSHETTGGLLDRRWVDAILKGQSFDGSWMAEPTFFAPNRGGNATWYASRLLTSAICYDALRTLA